MSFSDHRALSYDPEIFGHCGPLQVHAVFPHAWLLRSMDGTILSVVDSCWNGPLAMRADATTICHEIGSGMTATLSRDGLQIGAMAIHLNAAQPWLPDSARRPALDIPLLVDDVRTVRGMVRAASRGGLAGGDGAHPHPQPSSWRAGEGRLVPDDSIGADISPVPLGHLPTLPADVPAWLMRGTAEMSALGEAVVRQDSAAVGRHAVGLLGLGPGLTPSGDDVLCGVLAGLVLLGSRSSVHGGRCKRAADALARYVLAQAKRYTTSLSATLLRAAGRGIAVEPLLQVLRTMGSGRPLEGIDEVLMLGHSSGSDMLTGALMACATLVRWEEVFGPAMVGTR